MRYIIKGDPDEQLLKQATPNSARKAKRSWEKFKKKGGKKATLEKCLIEQYYLCGYSEISLNEYTESYHLEHIKPKKYNPTLTFSHDNLIVSAIDDVSKRGIIKEHVFGGHAKGSWNNNDALIHPLIINCFDYLRYEESSGLVVPNEKLPRRERAKARLTIYKLNLNSPVLVPTRQNVLQSLDETIKKIIELDHTKLESYAKKVLLPNRGVLESFHSAKKQLFGRVGQKVIAEYLDK